MKANRRRGSTVLELLIAVGIIASAGAAAVEGVRFAYGAGERASYQNAALAVAQSYLDLSRGYKTGLAAGTVTDNSPTGLPSGSVATITVTKDGTRAGMWTIQVDVKWTAGGRRTNLSGAVSLSTMIYDNH